MPGAQREIDCSNSLLAVEGFSVVHARYHRRKALEIGASMSRLLAQMVAAWARVRIRGLGDAGSKGLAVLHWHMQRTLPKKMYRIQSARWRRMDGVAGRQM